MEFLGVDIPTSGLIFLALLFLLYKYFTRTWGTWSSQGIPEVKPWFVVGSRFTVYKDHLHLVDLEHRRRYGRTWGEYEGRRPLLFTTDTELVKLVTVKEFSFFTDRRDFDLKQEIFQDSLDQLQGEKWKAVRSLLGPGFTGNRMKTTAPMFLECAKTLTEVLKQDGADGKKGLHLSRYYGGFGLDVIASYGFGVEISSMKDADNPFVKNALRLLSNEKVDNPMVLLPLAFPKLFHYMDFFPSEASDFFVKVIREIVQARKQKPDAGTRKDFLDIILQALKQLEENEDYRRLGITQKVLEAQLIVFFLAGFDTVKTTMSFTSYYLALHPEIQSKVREEILDAIKATDGEIRHDTLSKLPLLDACIAESLRLHPPLSRLERVTKRDFHYKNIVIPKDSLVMIPVYALHREEEEFPEPEVWKPERFLEENKKHDPYAYLPFGIGPRMCIGQRFAQEMMRYAFVHILKELEIVKTADTPEKVEYLKGFLFLIQPTNLVVGFRPLH